MIISVIGNLFDAKEENSLGHCISSDAAMSKGIAKTFVSKYPPLKTLRKTRLKIGTAVPVLISGRFIYNLVTKRHFWSKPILKTMKYCITSMRIHAEIWVFKAVCVPRLSAGLDLFNFDLDVLWN